METFNRFYLTVYVFPPPLYVGKITKFPQWIETATPPTLFQLYAFAKSKNFLFNNDGILLNSFVFLHYGF